MGLAKTAVGTLSMPKTDSASMELCLDGAGSSIDARPGGAGRHERPPAPLVPCIALKYWWKEQQEAVKNA